MTDRERAYNGTKNAGLEPTIIGNTVQWTTPNGTVVVQFFTPDGQWVKTEWH